MLARISRFSIIALLLGVAVGCDNGAVKQQEIKVQAQSVTDQIKTLLEGYSKGQQLGSETTSYEYMVNEMKKVDAGKGDTLKAGFEELQKTKGPATAAKAKELLKKLGLEK